MFFLVFLFYGIQSASVLERHIFNRQAPTDNLIPIPPDYRELFYDQTLDHYNFNDDRLFKQRYLLNDDWFNAQEGCIFFYTGSQESVIENWNSELFLAENAARFKALMVFAEHVIKFPS
jgi:hypothetical protein